MAKTTSQSFAYTTDDDLTPEEWAAWRGLLTTHARIVRRLDADLRAACQIGVSAYEALVCLAEAPDHRMRMSELAAAVSLTLSGMSRLISRLEREGLVRREVAAGDGRGACAIPTSAGLARLECARIAYIATARRLFFSLLAPSESRMLGALWERMAADTPALASS